MRRRLFLLLVASAAAAAAVPYYVGRRSREVVRRQPLPDRAPSPTSDRPAAERDPAEALPIVLATMEATTTAASRNDHDGFGRNGVELAEPEPAYAGSDTAPAPIEPEHDEPQQGRRGSGVTLVVLGALAGAGAIALGAWGLASSLSGDEGGPSAESPAALASVQPVASLLAKPKTAAISLQGSLRRSVLVIGPHGYGVLVLNEVAPAPPGKTYEAWVVESDVKTPQPAALFAGGSGVVRLTRRVPRGAKLVVTVEPEGGSPSPTQTPTLVATRA